MTLKIHNTLSRNKEDFVPIDPKNVRVYACGPTPYNYAHIGNGRAAVVFDLLVRVLRHLYGADHVQYVRNITDIDDKIIKSHQETGEPIKEITERYTRIYNEDMGAIGVLEPDHMPKATEYIEPMLNMIAKLIEKGHAYEAEGHVLFNVPSWKDYGKLSRRNQDDIISGARVEVAPYKKDPSDFVLWKPSTDDQPGWDSPYGRGRPGWHLECSAMNEAINGNHFDIHAGGEDLIFPHHENEIAQSVCAHDYEPYVNYWMHNGYLTFGNKKMSKSIGNVSLVHEILEQGIPGEVIRYALLSAQYRQPLEWNEDGIKQAKKTLDRYYKILKTVQNIPTENIEPNTSFIDALKDDLNTPQAFAKLSRIAKRLTHASDDVEKAKFKGQLLASGALIGLLQEDPESWFKQGTSDIDKEYIETSIQSRIDARANKDFAKADEIRDDLASKGIIIEDTAGKTEWRKVGNNDK